MRPWTFGAGLFAVLLAGTAILADDTKDKKPDAPDNKPKAAASDLDALFKKLDVDGDGKLTADEFKKLPEFYKPAEDKKPDEGRKGKFGKLDPETIKKLREKYGDKFGKRGEPKKPADKDP